MVVKKIYTLDIAYVEGVYRHDPVMERALYSYCKQYFEENYRGVFFIEGEYKNEIFQEAFVTLWEKIERRSIYVENGVLRGKDGKIFTSRLTTYFMSIAKFKYKEWVREHSVMHDVKDGERKQNIKDMEFYKEMLYDEDENAMLEIISDCISHMSERCHQILTLFYYKEKTLDDIMIELPTFKSKNALKTEKYKCMENLRKSANEIYHRYLKA